MNARNPPLGIARQLRQEAGFGCAVCGCPIIEYHHIIEWSEKQHFEPEHMVALCPTHHREFGKLSKDKSYSAKANPINIRTKLFEGMLGGNRSQKALRVGSMRILNCLSAVSYSGNSLFSYKLVEGEYRLSVFIPDKQFWPEVEVVSNSVAASIDQFWDIEFKTNWVKFRKRKGQVFLSIDFRNEDVEIDGLLNILGEEIDLRQGSTLIAGTKVYGFTVENTRIGLGIGPRGRIIRPNYAMAHPAPYHIRRE